MTHTEIENPPAAHQIVSTRVFDFPVVKVYEAWTNPLHLKNWWGPNGFTNTFHEYNLVPQGRWSFMMHGPTGANFPNECVFIKIVPQKNLVWNHISTPPFQVAVSFEELSGKTEVIFRMIFTTEAERDQKAVFVIDANEENFDRLEAELEKMK